MVKFNNNPFYQSTKEELEQIEKEAYETTVKELPKFNSLEYAKKWYDNVITVGELKGITSTVYQVERIQAIIRGIEKAYNEYLLTREANNKLISCKEDKSKSRTRST